MDLFVCVKSEVLSATNMNNAVLWNVTPCSVAEFRRRFEVTYYLRSRTHTQRPHKQKLKTLDTRQIVRVYFYPTVQCVTKSFHTGA
jgi:5-keto 4-deoxyuronate isomerase